MKKKASAFQIQFSTQFPFFPDVLFYMLMTAGIPASQTHFRCFLSYVRFATFNSSLLENHHFLSNSFMDSVLCLSESSWTATVPCSFMESLRILTIHFLQTIAQPSEQGSHVDFQFCNIDFSVCCNNSISLFGPIIIYRSS